MRLFTNWKQLYTLVLLVLFLEIILFYFITQYYA